MRYFILAGVVALAGCGGEIASVAPPSAVGPNQVLFASRSAQPDMTAAGNERTLSGSRPTNGLVSNLSGVTKNSRASSVVRWDGRRVARVDSTASGNYDANGGARHGSNAGLSALFVGSNDVATIATRSYGGAVSYRDHSNGKIRIGAVSMGNVTPNGSVPGSSTATYNGTSVGQAVVSSRLYDITGQAQMRVDFNSGQFNFSTSNLQAYQNGRSVGTANSLAVTSNGRISGTGFSGAILNGGMTGSMSGSFYGPNAEQAGGTYDATNNSNRSQVGAFIMQR